MEFKNLCDSHIHFLGTAEYLGGTSLKDIKSANDLKSLNFSKSAFRGEFLIAFGWDPQKISKDELTAENLDKVFPDFPVMLSRWDGHASWVNSKALQFFKNMESGGLLLEEQHFAVLQMLPSRTKDELKNKLLEGAQLFLQQGFTHLRDMTSSLEEAIALRELADEGLFKQHIDLNFLVKNPDELQLTIDKLKPLKAMSHRQVHIQGIKLFYDGTLGGGNAFVSRCDCCRESTWDEQSYSEALKIIWSAGFEIAVHCIGDQAVDDIVTWTRKVSALGFVGRLNIEHAEFVRPETIQKMKPLHVQVHMQPCHWFGDKDWLSKNADAQLIKWAFPWEALRKSQIPLRFGSDSPVVRPSVIDNLTALEQSAQLGIKKFLGNPLEHHQNLDSKVNGRTVFKDGQLDSVDIDGVRVYPI